MSEYFEETEEVKPQDKRPVLLTVLCILSFIALGFGIVNVLFSLVAGQPSIEEIESVSNQYIQTASDMRDQNAVWAADIMEQLADMTMYQHKGYWLVMLINSIMLFTGLTGVLFMMRGRRLGFHLYIIYNLLSIGGIYLVIPFDVVPKFLLILSLILSGLFVMLYSLNLKWMNK